MRPGRIAWLIAFASLAGVGVGAEVPVRESYVLHCSGCHLPDGGGVAGTVPSLREIGPLLNAEGGREYLTRVPGVAQAPLASDELAALLNFVLVEFAGAEGFAAFTAQEVEAGRAEPLRDPLSARPAVPGARGSDE